MKDFNRWINNKYKTISFFILVISLALAISIGKVEVFMAKAGEPPKIMDINLSVENSYGWVTKNSEIKVTFNVTNNEKKNEVDNNSISVKLGEHSPKEIIKDKESYTAIFSVGQFIDKHTKDGSEILKNLTYYIGVSDVYGNLDEKKGEFNRSYSYDDFLAKDVKFYSDNKNSALVKDGDNIAIKFITNKSARILEAKIAGENMEAGIKTTDNINWSINYKVEGKKLEDNKEIPFEITLVNDIGNKILITDKEAKNPIIYYSSINVHNLSLVSNNENKDFVKDGEVITLSFNTDHPVFIDNLNIAGQQVEAISENNKGMNWSAKYNVTNGKIKDQSNIDFNLVIKDAAGNTPFIKNQEDLPKIRYCAPIEISELIFYTNNEKNSALAKVGDVAYIKFKTNHFVTVNKAEIAERKLEVTSIGEEGIEWIASYKVSEGDTLDNTDIEFSLDMEDNAGNKVVKKGYEYTSRVRYYAPILINQLELTSSNEHNNIAKNGDILNLSFNTTHPIIINNISIAGKNVTAVSEDGMNWNAKYEVIEGHTLDQHNISMVLTVTDLAGNQPVSKSEEDGGKVKYFQPIKVSDIKVVSDNKNDPNKYIKDGETLTITFNTNHETEIKNSKIINKDVEFTSKDALGKEWIVNYSITNGEVKDLENISFYFLVKDLAGNTPITKTHEDEDVENKITYYAPIESSVSIESSGSNKAYAKNGDVIKISLKSNHEVTVTSSTIFGREVTEKNTGYSKDLSVAYSLSQKEASIEEGAVNFNVSLSDLAGNIKEFKDSNDNPKTMVTYDRTNPQIVIKPKFSGFSNKDIAYDISFHDANLDLNSISINQNGSEIISQEDKTAALIETKTLSKQIILSEEDQYNIYATITDLAGNKSNPDLKANVIIDKTNPNITSTKIDLDKPMVFKRGFVISQYFHIDEAFVKDIICKVTDSTGVLDWNINTPIDTEGKKTVYLLATDMSGNSSNELVYDLYIDGTEPKPMVKDMTSERELVSSENKEPFISKMKLKVSLDKLHIGNENPDRFTKLQLMDINNNLVKDVLKDNKPEGEDYLLNLDSLGEYKLLVNAIDDVGNETGDIIYSFQIENKKILARAENKTVFYSLVSTLSVGLIAIVSFVFLKVNKKRSI